MTTKAAIRILIRHAAANIRGTAQGIRPVITDTERAEVREAVERVFYDVYGREIDDKFGALGLLTMSNLPHRSPCPTCPWRVGIDAWSIGRDTHLDIPPLHYDQMVEMVESQKRGFGAKVMACHLTHCGEDLIHPHDRTCVGFALSEDGQANIPLRVLVIRGEVDLRKYSCTEKLHTRFGDMLRANPEREGENCG